MLLNTSAAGRSRRLKLALGSGFAGRIAGAFLQLISLPIAAVALGPSGFVIYSMSMAALGWIMLAQLGSSNAATRLIAASIGSKNPDLANAYISTGLRLGVCIAVAATVVGILMIFIWPGQARLFPAQAAHSQDLSASLLVILAISFVSLIFSSIESVQVALQDRHRANLYTIIGTVVAAVLVVLVSNNGASPVQIILAVQGPASLARLGNAIHFFWRHPHLSTSIFSPVLARQLFADGSLFMMSGAVTNFLAHMFPILLASNLMETENAAATSAVINGIVIFASVYAFVLIPLQGALPEAMACGDKDWVRRVMVRAYVMAAIIGTFSVLGVVLIGQDAFGLWYQGSINPSTPTLIWAVVYFAFLGFEIIGVTLLISLGRLHFVAILMTLRGACGAVVMIFFSAGLSPELVFATLTFSTLFFTAVPFTLAAIRVFR